MTAASPTLYDACRTGDLAEVCRLLNAEPDCLARRLEDDGSSLLHHAAFGGQVAVIEELLGRGADLHARTRSGYTPLHYAAFSGATEAAERLIAAGADVRAIDDSRTTVLHAAASGGVVDLVGRLIDAGLAPEVPNLYGETPLHRAAQANRLDAVRRLAERGAPIDRPDRYLLTPLHKAAIGGANDVLDWLLDSGHPLDVRDLHGDTPLHAAVSMGRTSTVQRLFDHGMSVSVRNGQQETPLHVGSARGDVHVVRVLLDVGADPDAIDERGETPLHASAAAGTLEVSKLLLTAGADPARRTNRGSTPCDLAITYGRMAVADWLAEHGGPAGTIDVETTRKVIGRAVERGGAIVWYLGHSGWAIRTESHLLLIDSVPAAEKAEEASLLNGAVVPHEWPDAPVIVFVTHHHGDHFSPRIAAWATDPRVRYVFGWNAEGSLDGYRFHSPGDAQVGDLHVASILATDAGSAFLIEVDGLRIYHAGDHAAAEIPPEPEFANGIEQLGKRFAPIDMAFLPVFGCGLPNVESLQAGNDLTIERLAPRVVFPMHIGWTGLFYRREADRLRSLNTPVDIGVADRPGDRFLYRDGRIVESSTI